MSIYIYIYIYTHVDGFVSGCSTASHGARSRDRREECAELPGLALPAKQNKQTDRLQR